MAEEKIEFLTKFIESLCEFDPKYKKYTPRVLSNPIFDYTQGKQYSIGDIYHKEGNFLKKRDIEYEIQKRLEKILDIKGKIKLCREHIKYLLKLRPKKMYLDDINRNRDQIPIHRIYIKSLIEEINGLKKKRAGLTSKWLIEHVYGRDFASKKILEIASGRDLPLTPFDTDLLLKRLAITIRVEVYTDSKGTQWHTKLNKSLEEIQRGNTTWEGYKRHVESFGYTGFDQISKNYFILEGI